MIRRPAWRWDRGEREPLCAYSLESGMRGEPSRDFRSEVDSALYVDELLAELPRRERAVMRMVVEGAAAPEIAVRLGRHEQAVVRLRARAVRCLRRALRAWGW